MVTASAQCPHCHAHLRQVTGALCPACQKPLFIHGTDDFHTIGDLSQCPLCGCAHLYRRKDFNRKLGIAILVLGIGLAYWTYALSLVAVTLLDWLLFRRVGEVACCYLCEAVFRDVAGIPRLEPFNLVLHDHYRAVREKA